MKIKATNVNQRLSIRLLIITLLACFSTGVLAQERLVKDKKNKKTPFNQSEIVAKFLPNLGLQKMKSDYDIAEAIEQYKVGEIWENLEKRVFIYNSLRSVIKVQLSLYDFEEAVWDEVGTFEFEFTEDGLPKSLLMDVDYDISSLELEQIFHYTEGVLDSVTFDESGMDFEGSYEYKEVLRFTYFENDSIRVESEYTEDGETEEGESSYFVQKGEDLFEVFENPGAEEEEYLLDRYRYSDIDFEEYLKLAFDEFYLVEIYNDEYYEGEGWKPFSRNTITIETSFLTTELYEDYYEDEGWVESEKYSYNYEDENITSVEFEDYFDEVTNYFRINYTYGGLVSNEFKETSKTFVLNQNYPNPFNPTTSINFELKDAGFITLKVFNILGKEVSTLVSGIESQGNYTVHFDASNLPSGLYYYTLTTKDFTQTKAMTLIK